MLGVVAQDTTLDLELSVRENLLVSRATSRSPRRGGPSGGRAAGADGARRPPRRRGRPALGWHAAAPPDRPRADQPPPPGAAGRAHHRPRPPGPPRRWERLRLLRSGGATLVLTTHYMDEAAQLCDRLVIMDHGRDRPAGHAAALVEGEAGREVLEVRIAPGDAARALAAVDGAARGHEARRRPADPVRRRRRGPARPHPRGGGRRPAPRRPARRAGGRVPAPHRAPPARLGARLRAGRAVVVGRRPRLTRPQRRAAEPPRQERCRGRRARPGGSSSSSIENGSPPGRTAAMAAITTIAILHWRT